MSTAIIRQCKLEDFDTVYELLKQLWPGKELHRDSLLAVFKKVLNSSDLKYFCAEQDGKVVGFCSLLIKDSLWQEGQLGYIGELVVDKSFRGKGIGSDLVKAVFQHARNMGCKRVEIDSAFSRKDTVEFYENMGFEKRAFVFSRVLD